MFKHSHYLNYLDFVHIRFYNKGEMRGNAMPVLVSLRITQNTIMKNKKLE